MEIHARAHYQFTRNLGAALDWKYVKLEEAQQDYYYALNNYVGNIFRISILYNL